MKHIILRTHVPEDMENWLDDYVNTKGYTVHTFTTQGPLITVLLERGKQ